MGRKALPRAGNTEELARLEKELAEALENNRLLEKSLADHKERLANEFRANADIRKSLELASEKIKFLETGIKVSGSEIAPGYVEIASCPFKGKRPPTISENGILITRRIDEDGIIYEVMSEDRAVKLLGEVSGFKRYLTGPKGKLCIKGKIQQGLYAKDVEYPIHKKRRDSTGNWEFIRYTVE